MQDIDGSQEHGYRTNRRAAITDSEGMADKHSDVMEPVPLYLVPHALAAEIRRLGGAIAEVHVRRTGQHRYAITVSTRGEDA